MNSKLLILTVILCLCASLLSLSGCAEVQYGGAKLTRLGDSKTRDLYAEHFAGAMRITVDANTGLHNYYLLDANSTYTRFSFGFSESEGKLPPIKDLAEALKPYLLTPED